MTTTLKPKQKRSRTMHRTRRVTDMTTDELRALIETLIDRKLAREKTRLVRPKITAPMRQRALSAVGRYHSGQSDISVRHDEYLTANELE